MPKLIVNLRGTSGSGKSTVAFEFLRSYPHELLRRRDGKQMGVRVDVPDWRWPLFFIGKYDMTTASGGMDMLPGDDRSQQNCVAHVERAYDHGHVFCEGLMASGIGPAGTFPDGIARLVGPDVRFLSLDTPLEVCLERVRET